VSIVWLFFLSIRCKVAALPTVSKINKINNEMQMNKQAPLATSKKGRRNQTFKLVYFSKHELMIRYDIHPGARYRRSDLSMGKRRNRLSKHIIFFRKTHNFYRIFCKRCELFQRLCSLILMYRCVSSNLKVYDI
jgi:hypothetical protein